MKRRREMQETLCTACMSYRLMTLLLNIITMHYYRIHFVLASVESASLQQQRSTLQPCLIELGHAAIQIASFCTMSIDFGASAFLAAASGGPTSLPIRAKPSGMPPML